MTDLAGRPLLFLDVDGTLLPVGGAPGRPVADVDWDAWQSVENTNLTKLTPSHGPRLLALSCDLMWATAWMHEANEVIAPLIGLPELPVVDLPAWEDEFERAELHWKTRTLVELAAGRPFVWIDDEITDTDKDWVAAHHPGRALLQRVESEYGITEADFAEVVEWLQNVL
jgi:hypothetical protein